jgi:hypothetical protein
MDKDMKIAIGAMGDGVYSVFGDKVTKVSDAPLFFMICHSGKSGDNNVLCLTNATKDNIEGIKEVCMGTIESLEIAVGIAPNLTDSSDMCQGILKKHISGGK